MAQVQNIISRWVLVGVLFGSLESLSKRRFCEHGRQITEGGLDSELCWYQYVVIFNIYDKT
jgi:hypothetical protein